MPPGLRIEDQLALRSQGASSKLNLRVEAISESIPGEVPDLWRDLLRIGAYTYWADQMVSRGGETDVFGQEWNRELHLSVPVAVPDFWRRAAVVRRLEDVLQFASGDTWRFYFEGAHFDTQVSLKTDAGAAYGNPDCVALFSGGADSLCAVVEAVAERGQPPVLVSHNPVSYLNHRQAELVQALRRHFREWSFPRTSMEINKIATAGKETSQRSRSFLYASLGAAVAAVVGVNDVLLADNGFVSINLPLNGQVIGTKATRSTHPKFLWLFNLLLAEIAPVGPRLQNPLWDKTKADVLSVLKRSGVPELLELTNSCAHSRGRPNAQPHCGVCSQCIDRQFATIAADLDEYDPAERYGTDIFTAELKDRDRIMAESYVRLIRRADGLSPEGLFQEFVELTDCVPESGAEALAVASRLGEVVRRQCEVVQGVITSKLKDHAFDLYRGLPESSLLRIAVQAGGSNKPPLFPSPVEPTQVVLTGEEEASFRKCRFRSRLAICIPGELDGRKSNVIVVGDKRLYLPDADFRLFVRLLLGLVEAECGWVDHGSMRYGGGMADEGIILPEALHQAFYRLRRAIRPALGDMKPTRFVQMERRRGRVSTHRRFITAAEDIASHPDPLIAGMARRLLGHLE